MSDRDYMAVVRNLLAKAESTNYPAEAEALLAKAQQLMSEHAIDEAMVANASRERSEVSHRTIVCQAPYASAKVSLLNAVAVANDCRCIRLTADTYQTVMVFGYERDLEHVEALFVSLSLQATRALVAQATSSKKFRRSFLIGFADQVGRRLAEARRVAQQEYEQAHAEAGGSVGLVLANRRDAVDRAFQASFPRARAMRTTASSASGVLAGRQAGNRADLGNARIGGDRGALPNR